MDSNVIKTVPNVTLNMVSYLFFMQLQGIGIFLNTDSDYSKATYF